MSAYTTHRDRVTTYGTAIAIAHRMARLAAALNATEPKTVESVTAQRAKARLAKRAA
jgi:hypothetical protein